MANDLGNKAPQAEGILSNGWAEGNFKQTDMPSMARDFVNPGDDPKQLLMRSNISRREADAAVLFLSKCEMFGIDVGEKIIHYWLTSRRSINGLSMQQLLALGIQQYPSGGITQQNNKKKSIPQKHEENED